MFNFTKDFLLSRSQSKDSFSKGEQLFRQNAVQNLSFHEENLLFTANVKNPLNCSVRISFDTKGAIFFADCYCINRYLSPKGYCEHIIATLLAIKENEDSFPVHYTRAKSILFDIFSHLEKGNTTPAAKKELKLEVLLTFSKPSYPDSHQRTAFIRLKTGEDKTYVVKDISEFVCSVMTGEQMYFGRKFSYDPSCHTFSPRDRSILDALGEMDEIISNSNHYGYYGRYRNLRNSQLALPGPVLRNILKALIDRHISSVSIDKEYVDVLVTDEDLPWHFSLGRKEEALLLQLQSDNSLLPLTEDGCFFFFDGTIYYLTEQKRGLLLSLVKGLEQSASNSILIPAELKERFASELLPALKQNAVLEFKDNLQDAFYQEPLLAEVCLDSEGPFITAELYFNYGERRFNPFSPSSNPPRSDEEGILIRDTEKEKGIISFFENSDFKLNNGKMYLEGEEEIFDFVYSSLPELQREADVYYSESFKRVKVRRLPRLRGSVGIDSSVNLLEFSFELEGVESSELFDLLASVRERRKYFRLRDGSFIPLESAEMQEMAGLVEELELKKSDYAKGTLRLPLYRAIQLEQAARENNLQFLQKSGDYRTFIKTIREPQRLECHYPATLEDTLRDYQKTGFKWFKALASCGFGGILADDMGLGKTLQALAFICSERENNPAPVLIVSPSSLIFNWKAEAEKFTPYLKTRVIYGTKRERKELLSTAGREDMLITSYALLRRDIDLYKGLKFSHCILDEAQNIKNPHSQSAAAVKRITARNFWALTGTPLENSLTELWSIFNCVLPGYLPSLNRFAKQYGGNGSKSSENLARKVSPFILRRLKKDVLEELPPKIESRMFSELTREQKKLYMAYVENIRQRAVEEIYRHGFEKSRILILAGLTRLRQICCHPLLFVENYRGESGKLLQLQELLRETIDSGHRILLFSQFTGMLKIIQKMIQTEKRRYFYLDGSTKTPERMEMVQAFNNREKDIFLISLKAGGTGLNLTGADVVILYDLWWNPAVEDQAADRAHRIGQEKTVQVIRMIAMGTIEEKIYELQQKKKDLIDKVIQPGETFLSALSEEELRSLLEI